MTAPQEVAAEPRNRVPVLLAGGLAVVLLLFVASKVLLGGGDDAATSSSPTVRRPATTVTTAAAAAPAPAEAAPVETFEVFNTKNPFMPLRGVVSPAAPSKGPVPQTVTPSPVVTPVAVTAPGAVAAPVTTVAPASVQVGATGGQATAPVRSTRVALLDVFTEGDRVVANVRVNDTVSKAAAGDTFASNFKVVSLDATARCGRFLFGDDQFRLCRGEELLK